MDRIGISFRSPLAPEEIRRRYIRPMKEALEAAHGGVYSNYLRQEDSNPEHETEHLIVFLVRDFKEGLRLVRTEFSKLDPPESAQLHNLNPSDPPY